MNERDRNREESLDRLFQSAGPIRSLQPDPHLPMRIRALAGAGLRTPGPQAARWTPRWAWVSLASATFALSIMVGGYIGYHAWASTEPATTIESTGETELLMAAWLQSGFVEDLSDEVQE